MEDVSISIN